MHRAAARHAETRRRAAAHMGGHAHACLPKRTGRDCRLSLAIHGGATSFNMHVCVCVSTKKPNGRATHNDIVGGRTADNMDAGVDCSRFVMRTGFMPLVPSRRARKHEENVDW